MRIFGIYLRLNDINIQRQSSLIKKKKIKMEFGKKIMIYLKGIFKNYSVGKVKSLRFCTYNGL